MPERRRIAIVPARNEEAAVGGVVEELRAFDPELDVVVIDDGSTDATGEVARAAGAAVVRLPFNLGIGAAVVSPRGSRRTSRHSTRAGPMPARSAPRSIRTGAC